MGGTATNLHGAARVTQDFDFVPDSSLDNFGRLAPAMHELNARLRVEGLTDDEAKELPNPLDAQTPTPTGRERVSATVTTGSSSLATVTERPLMLSDFECRWMRRCPQNTLRGYRWTGPWSAWSKNQEPGPPVAARHRRGHQPPPDFARRLRRQGRHHERPAVRNPVRPQDAGPSGAHRPSRRARDDNADPNSGFDIKAG